MHSLTSLNGLNERFNLYQLDADGNIFDLIWKWLADIIDIDNSLYDVHKNWIKMYYFRVSDYFKEKLGYLLEIEEYTKNI